MFKSQKIIMMLILTALIAAGCSDGSNPLAVDDSGTAVRAVSLVSIPAGTNLDSAVLYLTPAVTGNQTINIHRVTADWSEADVTWNSFNNSYDTSIAASFVPGTFTSIAIDVTDLARGWLDGSYENFGIILRQGASSSQLRSSEFSTVAQRPELVFYYNSGESPVSLAIQEGTQGEVEDAFIGGNFPTGNNGSAAILMVGYTFGFEQNSLIKFHFDITAPPAVVGDLVWEDLDSDGLQDLDEAGVADVAVSLYDCNGNIISRTVTDSEGYYVFDSVVSGNYYLNFALPDGYGFVNQDQGANDEQDSDVDPATGNTACFSLDPGAENLGMDAGIMILGTEEEDQGCTHSLVFWQKNSGFFRWQMRRNLVSSLLPIWLGEPGGRKSLLVSNNFSAAIVLRMGSCGRVPNEILNIYSQLLAAKLSIANGASDKAIAVRIAEIDAFLAKYDWRDWYRLSADQRKQVISFRSDLQDFNQGKIGPGACDERIGGPSIYVRW